MAKRENIWNIPNILTMLRVALIGVFIWQYAIGHRYWAMGVFLLAGATDFLDGYIARKHNLVTNFGKLMDPLADKLMLVTALACLMSSGLVPLWVVLVVVAKELVMVVGGYWMLRQGTVVQAHIIGKAATVVFVIAVVATFLHEFTSPFDTYLQILAVILSISAMVWYFGRAARVILDRR